MRLSGEETSGSEISKCKGPGVQMCLACLRSSGETGETGVEGYGVSMGKMVFQGWILAIM